MDYTVLRNAVRGVTSALNRCLLELVRAYESVNGSYELRTPKTKTPSITMGFCILGGYISCFEVQLQRAVMPCD